MEVFRIDTRNNSPNEMRDPYMKFNECFGEIVRSISSLRITQGQADTIYNSFQKLTEANSALIRRVCVDHSYSSQLGHGIEKVEKYVSNEIKQHANAYQRGKICSNSNVYVKPVEKAIGFQWKSKFEIHKNSARHEFQQTSFQYISIIEILNALFKEEKFMQAYSNNDHVCSPDIFERFCCGNIYKNSELFKQNPSAIQLLFSIDDFEPCAALKSKAGRHKICGVYMQVLNLPQRLLSKQEHIYLIALCPTNNLKQEFTSLDNVIELIVAEVKRLELIGITIGDQVLKGTMACFTFDNLGGNDLFGFVKGFRATHYCRICDLSSEECSNAICEYPDRVRKIADYDGQLAELQDSKKHVKGVKKACLLNKLKNFHILQNQTVDLMHDVMEGVIPFLLRNLFLYCVIKKILTKDQIVDRIRDFNFGHLFKNSKPSFFDLDKKNLNQNASQIYCLMVNVPFILFDKKDELNELWICVQSLLRVMQIIFSDSILESDLIELKRCIETHLKSYMDVFKEKLKPKHHFLTHYPSVIRLLGPVKKFWMMRMESKHKFFTDFSRKFNNFINLTKSLAVKHQQMMVNINRNYENDVIESKKKTCLNNDLISRMAIFNFDKEPNLYAIKFLIYNGIEYRKGFNVLKGKKFYHIKQIISDGKGLFIFACTTFKVSGFNSFCNSFEVEKDNSSPELSLLSLNSLKNKNSYEIIYHNRSMFIKAETLELRPDLFL